MLLYGGSGHAKVIIDCMYAMGKEVHGIFDDNPALKALLDVNVVGTYQSSFLPEVPLVIAIGNNQIRQKVAQVIQHSFGLVHHPSALISTFARVEVGTVVFHNAIVQAGAVVGKHCIINTAASVDHDCELGDFVHISPNAALCGNVKVGEGTHIGTGASVIPGVKIGKWCTIGAGAVVIKDIPDYAVAVGVPARIIKTKIL